MRWLNGNSTPVIRREAVPLLIPPVLYTRVRSMVPAAAPWLLKTPVLISRFPSKETRLCRFWKVADSTARFPPEEMSEAAESTRMVDWYCSLATKLMPQVLPWHRWQVSARTLETRSRSSWKVSLRLTMLVAARLMSPALSRVAEIFSSTLLYAPESSAAISSAPRLYTSA
ncbi:hypothetical protein D9M68_576770 [compost metagenome]